MNTVEPAYSRFDSGQVRMAPAAPGRSRQMVGLKYNMLIGEFNATIRRIPSRLPCSRSTVLDTVKRSVHPHIPFSNALVAPPEG